MLLEKQLLVYYWALVKMEPRDTEWWYIQELLILTRTCQNQVVTVVRPVAVHPKMEMYLQEQSQAEYISKLHEQVAQTMSSWLHPHLPPYGCLEDLYDQLKREKPELGLWMSWLTMWVQAENGQQLHYTLSQGWHWKAASRKKIYNFSAKRVIQSTLVKFLNMIVIC